MSTLLHKLGLSKALQFHDVFSIDDPDLLAFVPRPALALLLVFPVSETYEKFREEEDRNRNEYQGYGDGEEVIWYKQTIGNACGLIGLLHGVSNGAARDFIGMRLPWNARANKTGHQSDLSDLLQRAIPLKPTERADLLVESQTLENAHAAAAATGDTSAPEAEVSVDLHFVCFVKSANNHLWELDGGRKGPIDRGQLTAEDDVLSQDALDAGVRSFLKREEQAGGGDLRFSLLALSPGID